MTVSQLLVNFVITQRRCRTSNKSREAAVQPYLHLVSQTEFSVPAAPVSHSSIVTPSFTVEIHTTINESFNNFISVKQSCTLLY
jgi:hypothetical protein